jgi:hypothetical protein
MQPYKQTTRYTCAAASLAMIINHFKPAFALNRENEFGIWHRTAALPTKGACIYALAIYAHEQGLSPKVIVGNHNYKFPGYRFKAYKKKEIDVARISSKMFYNKAKALGIPVEEKEFTLDHVKRLLGKGNILLLRLVIGIIRGSKDNRRSSHYLAITGYYNRKFTIIDPRKGIINVTEDIVKEAFDKVAEVKRDHRMIIF